MGGNEVAILGAGPAGIAAAIQLVRSGIDPLLIEKGEVGGLLLNANLVENYLGFPEGISGRDLVGLFKEQLERLGIRVKFEEVKKLDYKEDLFFVETDRGVTESKIVVIATGTRPKEITDIAIKDDIRDRFFYEVYPIIDVRDKKIIIIGSGDAAFDYALGLSKKNDVTILNRSVRTHCLPILMDRCKKSKSISYFTNTEVRAIKRDGSGLEVTAVNVSDGKEFISYADYLIAAVGREPCTEFFGPEIKKNLDILQKTRRLFMIGDIISGIYRQTAISVGDGIRVAMEIYRDIEGENK